MEALLDTSVLIGPEPLPDALPDDSAISVVTLAELRLGVLIADASQRGGRLALLGEVERRFAALPVDEAVAQAYAEIVAAARQRGVHPRPFDALIAATARARNVAVYARDRDFLKLPGVKVEVVK